MVRIESRARTDVESAGRIGQSSAFTLHSALDRRGPARSRLDRHAELVQGLMVNSVRAEISRLGKETGVLSAATRASADMNGVSLRMRRRRATGPDASDGRSRDLRR